MDFPSTFGLGTPSPSELATTTAFVSAVNLGDLPALISLFSRDALVNDQLRNFWGIDQISAWLAQEIVGERVSIGVRKVIKHYDFVILNAEIEGDFEHGVVNQPMLFNFHFALKDGKVVQLLILLAREGGLEPDIR